MLHTKFQASEPSGSEEDFLIFDVFLSFEPRTPLAGQFGTLNLHSDASLPVISERISLL